MNKIKKIRIIVAVSEETHAELGKIMTAKSRSRSFVANDLIEYAIREKNRKISNNASDKRSSNTVGRSVLQNSRGKAHGTRAKKKAPAGKV